MIDRDNIIRMAREAGLAALLRDTQKTHEALERFAALVAAAEREACASIADAELNPYPPEAPVSQYQSGIFTAAEHIAETIRARSNPRLKPNTCACCAHYRLSSRPCCAKLRSGRII